MSKVNTKNNNSFTFNQQHFLVSLYEQQKKHMEVPLKHRYNHGKSVKSRRGDGSSCICWLICSLFIKLLCSNTSAAETLAVVAPPINIGAAISMETSAIDATAERVDSSDKIFTGNKPKVSKRSQHSTFSVLEKEVGMTGIPSKLSNCTHLCIRYYFYSLFVHQI